MLIILETKQQTKCWKIKFWLTEFDLIKDSNKMYSELLQFIKINF